MVLMSVVGVVSFGSLVGISAHIIREQDKLERMSLMDNTIVSDNLVS